MNKYNIKYPYQIYALRYLVSSGTPESIDTATDDINVYTSYNVIVRNNYYEFSNKKLKSCCNQMKIIYPFYPGDTRIWEYQE